MWRHGWRAVHNIFVCIDGTIGCHNPKPAIVRDRWRSLGGYSHSETGEQRGGEGANHASVLPVAARTVKSRRTGDAGKCKSGTSEATIGPSDPSGCPDRFRG